MIEDQGWSASKEDALVYRLLVWASDSAHSGHSLEDAGKALGPEPDVLYGILKQFWDSGFAKDTERANVPSLNSVFLTGEGSATARKIAAASNNGGKRRTAIRNGIVDWLSSVGEPYGLSDFLQDPRAAFFGVPYTEDELIAAGDYLHDKGIIKGIQTGSGEFVRPSLTSEGLDCADGHSSDVQAYLNRSQTLGGDTLISVSDSYGVNIANRSSHVSQSVGITREKINEIQQLVASYEQARMPLLLDAENDSRLTELSEEILEEISKPVPDKSKVKGFLESLHNIGVSGAGNALGSVLGQAALNLMGSI